MTPVHVLPYSPRPAPVRPPLMLMASAAAPPDDSLELSAFFRLRFSSAALSTVCHVKRVHCIRP